jgi:hypothetical protein
MRLVYGSAFDFAPRSWLLPTQRAQLEEYVERKQFDADAAAAAATTAAVATAVAAADIVGKSGTKEKVNSVTNTDGSDIGVFIVKPARSSRGRNIFLASSLAEIDAQLIENADAPNSGCDTFVAQVSVQSCVKLSFFVFVFVFHCFFTMRN